MTEKEWLFRSVSRALYGEVVMRPQPADIDDSQSLVLVLATVWRSSCTWSQCGTSDARWWFPAIWLVETHAPYMPNHVRLVHLPKTVYCHVCL